MPGVDLYEPLDDDLYRLKPGYASVITAGSRGPLDVDGQRTAGGAQTFTFARGAVQLGWGVGWGGQYFVVVGIQPVGAYGALVEAECDQRDAPFRLADVVTIQGEPVTIQGEPVFVRRSAA